MSRPRLRPGGAERLAMGLLLAAVAAAMLAVVTRRVTPPARTDGPPLLPSASQGPAAPSAEAEGHPVFEYPAPSGVIRLLGGVRPPVSRPPTPTATADPHTSRSRSAARTGRPQTPVGRPPAPSDARGAQGRRQTRVRAEEGRSTETSPAQSPAAVAAPPLGPPTAGVGDQPSEAPTPAAPGATPSPATIGSTPILRPPVLLDQPPLHPVLRATITSGPGGGSAVEEAAVRGRVKLRLLVRSDGGVGSVEVVISSGDAALDEAARLGPLRWRFVPATRDGVPIDAYLLIWITFTA